MNDEQRRSGCAKARADSGDTADIPEAKATREFIVRLFHNGDAFAEINEALVLEITVSTTKLFP